MTSDEIQRLKERSIKQYSLAVAEEFQALYESPDLESMTEAQVIQKENEIRSRLAKKHLRPVASRLFTEQGPSNPSKQTRTSTPITPEEKRYWASIRWTEKWWRQWFSKDTTTLVKNLGRLLSPNIGWVCMWLLVAGGCVGVAWDSHRPLHLEFWAWTYLIGQVGYNIGVDAERVRQMNTRN